MSDQDVIKKLLESLRQHVTTKNQIKCLEVLGIIGEYFDGALSQSQINYALELLLMWDNQKINILRFLAKALHLSKTAKFNECIKKVFELIQTLTKAHVQMVKPYSKDIVGACSIYIHSDQIGAFEKQCALQTIFELVQLEALSGEVDIQKIILDTLKVFDIKSHSNSRRLNQHVYELLGLLSKKHPDKFDQLKATELRHKMLNTIQSLYKDDKAETSLALISGAVNGLKNHLVNFTPTPEQDSEFSGKLYECMVELSDPEKLPSNAFNNRVAFRNMLQMIHQYGGFHEIPSLLFRDYKLWHKVLNKWINSTSYEDKSAGIQATQTFHQQIARILETTQDDDNKRILLFFMKHFQDTLESPNSQPHEIRIAIRGFGLMAAACKVLLEPKYLCEHFDLVMQRTEYSYHTKDRLRRREVLEHLPNYVESLSKIMNQLDEISGIQLQSLESIVVILIKDFHFLSTAHHSLVAKSLLETFTNLQKLGGNLLDKVLETAIWQGILWTCSHQLSYDLQENIENVKDWKETITYRKYLPLWKRLITPEERQYNEMSKKIYSFFIKDLFLIIEKLDLSTKKRKFYDESVNEDKEFFFSDPGLDLEPVRAENFQILYNLVQFYSDTIVSQSIETLQNNFIEWLEHWLEESTKLACKHPLVSGFLQLIEIALKVINRTGYSTEVANVQVPETIEQLGFFIKSTLVSRCPMMSGELQIACLQLIFQVPTAIIINLSEEMSQIFTVGFQVGQSMLVVAHHALTCFERTVDSLAEHPKSRRMLLEQVLPCLEVYLSSRDGGETGVKQYKRGRKFQKIVETSSETDLMRIKKRILLFLGRLDPEESQLVLSKYDQKLVRDHVTNIFRIKLECDEEIMPLIFVDEIVNRICQLAMSSSERATKISACELLHGLILYMMGKNLDGTDTLPLWKDLCTSLVVLGADKDQTVRQLFEPLSMQMMHFFAQPSKILSPMATTLIESLLITICYQGNSGVQDLSARLLREFILWMHRTTDRNQRKASPIKLVDFFQEMRKMSIETDASRRMGATLAFNNIYRIIREDDELIDVYWIYLLDIFGTNFKSSEDFSTEIESNFIDGRRFEQVSSSMDHLTRVFVERSDIFHRSNGNRIRPNGFEGISLKDVLKWLLQESGRSEYHYRHKCMEMFIKILPECGTVNEFFEENLSVDEILSIGEENGIAKKPDLNHLSECQEPIFKEIYKWLQSLLTTLDFYIWIFENEIIPSHLTVEFLERSVVMKTVSFFIKSIVNKDITELVLTINEALFSKSQISNEMKMRNRNVDSIDSIRSIILLRIFDLVTILMKTNQNHHFLDEHQAELLKLTRIMIFKPQKLGLDYKSKNSLLKLSKRLISFAESVDNSAPIEFREQMVSSLERKLIKYLNEICQNCENLMDETTADISNINQINGIDLVISKMLGFLNLNQFSKELLTKTAEVLLKKLFDGVAEVKYGIHRPRHLKPSMKAFMSSIMKFCFKIDALLDETVKFAFNDVELKISESCIVRHGDHFMQIYRNPLYDHFLLMIKDTIQLLVNELKETTNENRLRIMSIITQLNEFIFKHHSQDVELLKRNLDIMILQWQTIMETAMKMENKLNCVDLALIDLLTHIAMTSPIEHIELGKRLDFQTWLFNLLQNRDNSLELKTKAIVLLPCVTSQDDKTNEKLMKALNSIQQKHMPLRSHEFPEGSLERASLVAITDVLLQALTRSRSPVIYRFIINATIADNDFILESKLQNVQVDLMETSSAQEQAVLMNQTFEAFMTGGFAPEIRLSLITRFLLTIMKHCQIDAMIAFIRDKMSTVWELMDSSLNVDTENAFVDRCGGYMMIEAFVASVPKEKIEKERYTYKDKINTGIDLIKDLIKKMKDVRRDVIYVVDDPIKQELFRKFHCYCYRALAATVSNTKDNPQLFNITLFKEIPEKQDFIWRKLIDVRNDDLYANWTQEFQELPRLKEYIVSVKDLQTSATSAQRRYIENVSIFDRSLSQSLTKTDLTYSVVLSKREVLEREQQRRDMDHQKTMVVQLESTPINDHEIMSVLVGVLNSIYKNKISPFTDLDTKDEKKYEWVLSLAASMRNPNNHKNVRIFLAKLIDNCRDIFVHYAKQLMGSVLSVITDGCVGNTMNFFITDLVTMLLSWSHVHKPTNMTEKQDAGALLKFLMENAFNERNEIFKLNLELIKKLVETWSEVLVEKIPTQTLLDLLKKPIEQESNQKLRCGIQLNAVVLANDLTPWNTQDQRDLFIKAIVRCFDSISGKSEKASAQVYQAAAQLLGMCLNKIIGDIPIVDENENFKLIGEITQKLERIQKKTGSDPNVFLQLLYGIQKEFPRILDQFMTFIKFNIHQAVRKIKCIYLEMYLSRLEIDGENVFREVIAIGVKDLLKQNEYQLLSLHIINKSLDHLKPFEVVHLLDDLSCLMNSPNNDVRRILVEIMIFIFEKYQNDDLFDKKKPLRIILRGFTDSDKQIQNRVSNFLSAEGALSKKFLGRFVELLSTYYDPTLEKEFLHYATQLLLDIPIRHPRSKKPLLDYDTTKDREFFEYPITTKSSSQRSLPPMFIQSQQRQLIAGDGSIYDDLVRSTQLSCDNRIFTPTQDPAKMTQVSQSFAFHQTQNSLFFTLKPQFLDRRSKSCSQSMESADDIEAQIARNKEKPKLDALDYLRKRVVSANTQSTSKEYALKAIDRRNYIEARQHQKVRQAREGREVVIYRRYRLGDLPDFFFNGLAILMPLQVLVKKDDSIAREIFISIFQSILDILKESEEDDQTEFFSSVNNSIMSILQQTKNSDSFFIGSLVELAMKSEKYLEISPDVLSNVVSMSNTVVTGALFLESQLNHLMSKSTTANEEDDEPRVKRLKFDVDNTKLKHWLKLIELYYKMNEYEVVEGIFTEKLNLVPETKNQLVAAINFESNSRFIDASKIYQQLIVKNAQRNANEKEFYYQSYFNCLANLSDWREITKEIRGQFSGYKEVWDDNVPFHKQILLPHLLKSELRMILNENADDEFLSILEDWMNDEQKSTYLREVFAEEVTMLHIMDGKNAEGCVEAEKALRDFGEEWSSLDMLDEKLQCLKGARNIAELTNFVHLMTSSAPMFDKLYQSWKLSCPKPSDSLIHWSDLIAYRENFLNLIDQRSQGDAACHLLENKRSLLNAAFLQRNCDAARFMINGLKDELNKDRALLEAFGDDRAMEKPAQEKQILEKQLKISLAIGKFILMEAEQRLTSSEIQIEKLCNGLKTLSGVIRNDHSRKFASVLVESKCCASETSWKLWKTLEKCQQEGIEISDDYKQCIMNLIGENDDGEELGDHLLKFSETGLKEARNLAKKHLDKEYSPENESLLAGAFLKMGQFCHQVYSSGAMISSGIQSKIMSSIFRAIAYGSDEAKVFIPYVLQLPDLKNNALSETFNQELNMVPEWMFISYISQILSNYNFEEECYLDGLLLKLASKYPNALYFPFKLSRSHYLKDKRGMEKENVAKIIDLISNPTMDKFVGAIQCLVLPEKMLETHFQKFDHFIEATGAKMTNEKFQDGLRILYDEVFVSNRDVKGTGYSNIKDFNGKLQQLKSMNWDKEKRLIIEKIRVLRTEIKNILDNISKRRIPSIELHKLSNWLAEYKWCGDKDFIEIPGQYTSDSKPFVEQYVKIVRFDHRLKVFSSKQLPIEVKVHGSDGKTYNFIVKYGEDLRQDQRIQQALELMSHQLSMDKNCKQNHLKIQTYQVIPINSSCGMLSVVQNATTISDYLQEASKQLMERNIGDFLPIIREQFRNFLLGDGLTLNWAKTYENGLLKRSRQQLAEELAAKEAMIPKDVLRRSFMNSAMTLETFYILRKNFITSLAAMNIANWMLGIGDRHLSNILIDVKTGRLIGIDFGIAFGAAANLYVPEIVPFRLTSHFVNVLEPLGVNGMIRKNMIHVMRCLRDYSQTILICLEVFVKEPTMDWQMRSKMKSVGNAEGGALLGSSEWNPEARITIVQRKLEGANPARITQDELSVSKVAANSPLLKAYERLAFGDENSIRRSAAENNLTPEEQVSCLIEMATDKALLASVYLGWDPWV